MRVDSALKNFLLAKRADGLSGKTVIWYERMLNPFALKFQGEAIENITANQMRHYVVSLRERGSRYGSELSIRPQITGGLSYESVSSHIRALKTFWNWSTKEYQLQHNPMANVRRQPRHSASPKAISLDDLKALLAATGKDMAGIRDRAILLFLLDTGCRVQGLLGLKTDDLELDAYCAYVVEKGSKRRVVYFTTYTAELLRIWMHRRPQSSSAVFCSLSNRHYGQAMTYDGFKQLMNALKKRAGVKGRVNPHSFRHAYAREYLRNGGDLSTLSRLMGHSDSLVTSWYYGVFTAAELAEMHRKHSPVNELFKQAQNS